MLEEKILHGDCFICLHILCLVFFFVCFLFVLYVVFKCSDYRLGLPVCETLIRYFVP